jgi:hypothetical protein
LSNVLICTLAQLANLGSCSKPVKGGVVVVLSL